MPVRSETNCAINVEYCVEWDAPLGTGAFATVYPALRRAKLEVAAVKAMDLKKYANVS